MTKKKILIFFGIAALFLLGLLTGYLASITHQNPQGPTQLSENDQLKEDLSYYITNKLKEEKKNSTLVSVSVLQPTNDPDGSLRFPYTVSFTTPVDGHDTSSVVEATAVLKKTGDTWRVVKVLTAEESISFSDVAFVTH